MDSGKGDERIILLVVILYTIVDSVRQPTRRYWDLQSTGSWLVIVRYVPHVLCRRAGGLSEFTGAEAGKSSYLWITSVGSRWKAATSAVSCVEPALPVD